MTSKSKIKFSYDWTDFIIEACDYYSFPDTEQKFKFLRKLRNRINTNDDLWEDVMHHIYEIIRNFADELGIPETE